MLWKHWGARHTAAVRSNRHGPILLKISGFACRNVSLCAAEVAEDAEAEHGTSVSRKLGQLSYLRAMHYVAEYTLQSNDNVQLFQCIKRKVLR